MSYSSVMRKQIIYTIAIICLANFGLCDIPYRYTQEKYPVLSACLLKILEDEIVTKNLVIISEEIQEDMQFKNVLKIDWDRIIVSSYNVSTVSGLFIFLPDSNTTISYDKIMKIKHEDYNSLYIVCTDNIKNILDLFDVAWEYKVIDVIALLPSSRSGRISVYTYFPYGPFGCSTTDPVRINIYEPATNDFQFDEALYSKINKLSNFYNCPIRVTVSDKPAEAISNYDVDLYKGVSVTLFHFLQQELNFTPQVVFADREANTYAAAYYNFTSAVVLNIVKGYSDIGVGRFSQLVDYHKDIDAPAQTSMDCFTWAVPMKAGAKPSVWTTSVYEFDFVTWILIIISLIIVIYIFRLLNRLPFSWNRLDGLTIFAILLNASTNMKMKSQSMKVFISCWLLYCFVMTAAYSASLGSLVTVPPYSSDIQTTQQLLEKEDIVLAGDPKMFHILSASSETSSQIKNVLDQFVILLPGEFQKIIHKIYTNRNIAVFYTKNKLIQEENKLRAELKSGNIVHIMPKCLITSHTSPLIMRKGSVLMEPVKAIVVRLLECGILHYWDHREEEEDAFINTTSTANKFTISQLRGALIVAITGYLISIAVFFYEILSTQFDKKPSKPLPKEIYNKKIKMKFIS